MVLALSLGLATARTKLGGGSSPYPPWLPQAPSGARPIIYFDAANNHWWGNGTEQTSAMLIQDTDWGNWDASNILPGLGIQPSNSSSPVIDSSFMGSLPTTGATIVHELIGGSLTSNLSADVELVELPNYTSEYSVEYLSNGAGLNQGQYFDLGNSYNTIFSVIASPIKMASTIVPSVSSAMSINGAAATTGACVALGGALNHVCISLGGNLDIIDQYLKTLAIYAPQPDTDLPTLSA